VIAFDLLIELPDRNTVKLGEVCIENYFLIAQHEDLRSDFFAENNRSFIHSASPALRSQFVISKINRSHHNKPRIADGGE
jgi:phosphatidylserine/phosphatidylglycerophosphate/cardiolipin synthase-like enzyme